MAIYPLPEIILFQFFNVAEVNDFVIKTAAIGNDPLGKTLWGIMPAEGACQESIVPPDPKLIFCEFYVAEVVFWPQLYKMALI